MAIRELTQEERVVILDEMTKLLVRIAANAYMPAKVFQLVDRMDYLIKILQYKTSIEDFLQFLEENKFFDAKEYYTLLLKL